MASFFPSCGRRNAFVSRCTQTSSRSTSAHHPDSAIGTFGLELIPAQQSHQRSCRGRTSSIARGPRHFGACRSAVKSYPARRLDTSRFFTVFVSGSIVGTPACTFALQSCRLILRIRQTNQLTGHARFVSCNRSSPFINPDHSRSFIAAGQA
jgi:hypothetical protein